MNKPTILCVDDEKIVLISLKEQLKHVFQDQYDVEVADSGELALDVMNELVSKEIDVPLMIVDQVMSGMKGDELLVNVHKISPRTKKVMLTGHANAEAVGNAVNHAELYRYIAKPWEFDDLTLTAKSAIYSYFQDKKLEEQNKGLLIAHEKLETLNKALERKIEVFNKFVPAEFIKLLTLDKEYIELGQCAERTLSVMFADIHSFTSICEALPLQEIFEFINSFLSDIAPDIKNHDGFIDKFVGDAAMTLFIEADQAVQSAIDIQKRILAISERNLLVPYRVGTSVNTGQVMIGTVGEPGRMETTAIGDTVNVASRIEGLTKIYDTPLIISEYTVKSLRNPAKLQLRSIDTVTVKGRIEPLELFEVLDALPDPLRAKKLAILETFKQAHAYYLEHNHLAAKRLFHQCLKECPEDEISKIYLNRIDR